jgi:hypothetical protein
MTNFGWSYPAGCSGPPDDYPEAGPIETKVDESFEQMIDRIAEARKAMLIEIGILEAKLSAPCPVCEARENEAFAKLLWETNHMPTFFESEAPS